MDSSARLARMEANSDHRINRPNRPPGRLCFAVSPTPTSPRYETADGTPHGTGQSGISRRRLRGRPRASVHLRRPRLPLGNGHPEPGRVFADESSPGGRRGVPTRRRAPARSVGTPAPTTTCPVQARHRPSKSMKLRVQVAHFVVVGAQNRRFGRALASTCAQRPRQPSVWNRLHPGGKPLAQCGQLGKHFRGEMVAQVGEMLFHLRELVQPLGGVNMEGRGELLGRHVQSGNVE